MPIEFKLDRRLAGFAAAAAEEGGRVAVIFRELIPPSDASHFLQRVEHLQRSVFSQIPALPPPAMIDHLLVVINPDLSAVAYVNELNVTAVIEPNRPIQAGEAVRVGDITGIDSVELGVEVPEEAALVLIRSRSWGRSLYYDLGPILEPPVPREYSLEGTLATQQLMLIGLLSAEELDVETRIGDMKAGLARLKALLEEACEDEGSYQELLEQHPWMLGGVYDLVERHTRLGDARIPDFTARRCYDGARDIVEIKQPFLTLFQKTSGKFAAPFNNAWNQAEDYLSYAERHRGYLRDDKDLVFENPRCILLLGHDLDAGERKRIRAKETRDRAITVLTYDELLRTAQELVRLMDSANERIAQEVRLSTSPSSRNQPSSASG